MTDTLNPRDSLGVNASITSVNEHYTLIYQGDCNLVLYDNYRFQNPRALWESGTYGKPAGTCVMQNDGNLVIYDPNWKPLWSSKTWGNPGSRLVMQDDGNLVIYKPDWTPLWDKKTYQSPLRGDQLFMPVVTRNADGGLEVFIVGQDRELYHRWQVQPNNGWNDKW